MASGLGAFMGVTHAATHESKVDPTEAATLKTAFENRPMRDVQLEYVFSKCYREAEAAAELRDDAAFMAEIASLKAAYDGKVFGRVFFLGSRTMCVLDVALLAPLLREFTFPFLSKLAYPF